MAVNTIHEMFTRDVELGTRLFLQPVLEKLQRLVVAEPSDQSILKGNDVNRGDGDSAGDKNTVIDTSDACQILSGKDLNYLVHFVSDVSVSFEISHNLFECFAILYGFPRLMM